MALLLERLDAAAVRFGANATVPPAAPLDLNAAFSADNDGVVMTLATFAMTLLLELASIPSVRLILRQRNGPTLYLQAIYYNLVNNGVLGPLSYWFVLHMFVRPALSSMLERAAMICAILLGHAVGYYLGHRAMHTRRLYWAHKFHHQFKVNVSPVVANAVSFAEYAIAYMLPFIAGCALLRPDRASLFIAVGVVSLNNLLIHTPVLSELSGKLLPWWAVSTADHLEHHHSLTKHWAAPTLSIDRLLACAFGKPASWGKEFKEA